MKFDELFETQEKIISVSFYPEKLHICADRIEGKCKEHRKTTIILQIFIVR